MKIKCLIVDDEPLAIEVIESHLRKIDLFTVVAKCQNAFEAHDWLNKKKIDLIFLDIQMPGMKGTDFIKNLKNPPKVILTTAYREYAVESYEFDAIDYLVKPVSFERFFKAINKFLHSSPHNENISITGNTGVSSGYIYVRVNKKINKIYLHEILYTESIKDYITIHTLTRNIIAKYTLSAFEGLLPENDFLRIHRSFIVSLKHITGFSTAAIEISGTELPIGRNYKLQVFRTLNYSSNVE
jgi:two-component system LytT family response regulator